ncbi:MAG: WG repeat-containing protein [Stappiaceae bacterium]
MSAILKFISLNLFLVFLHATDAWAQAAQTKLVPKCTGAFHLCGFIDRNSGNWVIGNRFERVFPFSEGLALVQINGRYGFIDRNGMVVIQPKFELSGGFKHGLAEVIVNRKAGLIDQNGSFVLEPKFARAVVITKDFFLIRHGEVASRFIEGASRVFPASRFYPNVPGPRAIHPRGFNSNHWQVYDRENGLISDLFDLGDKVGSNRSQLRWAVPDPESDGKYRLLDIDGKWALKPQFSDERNSLGDYIPIVSSNGRAGALNKHGKVVVPPKYDNLTFNKDGYFIARSGTRLTLIDAAGVPLSKSWFKEFEPAAAPFSARAFWIDRWVSFDKNWQKIPDQLEGRIMWHCPQGLTILLKSGKYQLETSDGPIVAGLLLDHVGTVSNTHLAQEYVEKDKQRPDCQSSIKLRLGNKKGIVKPDGKLLAYPIYDYISDFRNGYAIIGLDRKYGLIDSQGQVTLPPIYRQINRTKKYDVFLVVMDKEPLWIDPYGRAEEKVASEERKRPTISPAEENRSDALRCGSGSFVFQSGNLWGIKGENGDVVLAPNYRAVTCFLNGVAWVANDKKRLWCPIGPDGIERDYPTCEIYISTKKFSENNVYINPPRIQGSFSADPYESSVLWNRAFREYGLGKRDAPPKFMPNGGTRF